jgi:hypothetical protein
MSTFKKAKVIMLPTNKPSKLGDLVTYQGYSLAKVTKEGVNPKNTTVQFWNLYIISDDEIKEGDWCLFNELEVVKCTYSKNGEFLFSGPLTSSSNHHFSYFKKIITTTNTTLKIDNPNYDIGRLAYINLPQPSQQFIEKYIEEYNKSNIITNVLVEYELISNEEYFGNTVNPDDDVPYFNERLKINPKDNTITIRKVKDSWNRGEVIILLKKVLAESKEQYSLLDRVGINKWIEENL